MNIFKTQIVGLVITSDPVLMEADAETLGGVNIQLFQVPIAAIHGNGDCKEVLW
jgi:hypothetical protein